MPDVRADPDYLPGDDGVVAEIAVPLLGDDETLGVLNIESEQAGGLTPGDLRLARAIADRLATALLRNQEQEALRDRMRLFAALTEFAGVANAILDPQLLAAALVDAVGAVVPSDTLVITTLDRTDGQFRVRAVRGLTQDAVGETIRPGDGNTGRAITERAVVSVDRHERAQYSAVLRDRVPFEFMCGIAVPLIHEDAVLGVISVGRAGADATFTSAEREVIVLLGSQAALALANAYLVAEVSALAIHDGLTGLYNRRHYDAALDLAIARFKRRGAAGNLAAIMFDLDHFGEFNRLHGHLVRRCRAPPVRQGSCASDCAPRTSSRATAARSSSSSWRTPASPRPSGWPTRFAASWRRARCPAPMASRSAPPSAPGAPSSIAPSPTKEALLSRADVGLFMAKRAGRNQVVAA